MAHLWILDANDMWHAASLDDLGDTPFVLTPSDPAPSGNRANATRALLVRAHSQMQERWLLLSSPAIPISVNGVPVESGLRVLEDRDELVLSSCDPARRLFFSTERHASVESFPASDRPTLCPRCKQPLAARDRAVRCPRCACWHHESYQLNCWTYAPHCAACDQPTDLDAAYSWTPAEL